MKKMNLVEAIKTKLRLVDKQAESAWRADWDVIYGQIQPQDRRTVAASIKAFIPINDVLIRAKAAAMMVVVSDVLAESTVRLRDDEIEMVRGFVLNHFEAGRYLERMKTFLEAVGRKFGRTGMTFHASEWRTDLAEALFNSGVKNTLQDMCAFIEADFTIIAARRTTETGVSPSSASPSSLSAINQCLELKPNLFGFGINLNGLIDVLLRRFR